MLFWRRIIHCLLYQPRFWQKSCQIRSTGIIEKHFQQCFMSELPRFSSNTLSDLPMVNKRDYQGSYIYCHVSHLNLERRRLWSIRFARSMQEWILKDKHVLLEGHFEKENNKQDFADGSNLKSVTPITMGEF